ncbi:peptidase S1 [Oceanicaulis alexandrii]|uniref:peptidase S1 n=1 Tax=Oceanicaulis alexandrii TaxID=153233 RepID=UPI0035CF705D
MRYSLIAAVAAVGMIAVSAHAQNVSLSPTYGTLALNSGFSPDPYVVSLEAGGSIAASNIGCTGYIANAPDLRLNYRAGEGLPLIISVSSEADTTLVINTPNGGWACNDDGGDGSNPSIRFNAPQSGQYDIWVGTYSSGGIRPADLHISELYSQ